MAATTGDQGISRESCGVYANDGVASVVHQQPAWAKQLERCRSNGTVHSQFLYMLYNVYQVFITVQLHLNHFAFPSESKKVCKRYDILYM